MSSTLSIAVDVVYHDTAIQISIPRDIASDCKELVASFYNESNGPNTNPLSVSTAIELHSRFLKYCADHNEVVAKAVLQDFECRFLCEKDIHVVCDEFCHTEDQACTVLGGYFSMWSTSSLRKKPAQAPALFNSSSINSDTKLMALFGGQGGSASYFDDLSFLYYAYNPLVSDFVNRVSSLLSNAILDHQFVDLYEYGLEFDLWLNNPKLVPPPDYLFSSPVSFVLTGFTQLLQFLVMFKTLGIKPGDLTKSFEVAVGHSHAIVVATAISCSTDEASFYTNANKALGILLTLCAFSQLEHPLVIPNIRTDQDNSEPDIGIPRPMVLVRGLSYNQLNELVTKFNRRTKNKHSPVCISVVNTANNHVVSGTTFSSADFIKLIYSECALPGQDQSCIPHSQRKPVVNVEYLNLTVPYHCNLFPGVVDKQHSYAVKKGWVLRSEDMQIPVRANDNGHDISSESDLTRYLLQSVVVLPVNWPIAIDHPGITHIVDFGTGGKRGFGKLAQQNIEGRGISVIFAGIYGSKVPGFGTRADLYRPSLSTVVKSPNWSDQYSPTLVRTKSDDKVHISTRASRLLGKLPVMVSGVQPASAGVEFVASVLNAGYHTEFSCDGISDSVKLTEKINRLVDSIEPGYGITLDCNYSNTERWSFQFPTVVELRRKGIPIEGLCISGGIPPLNIATEIIRTICSAGFYHITFRPESIDSIHHVIDIAKSSSDFPIILQWNSIHNSNSHSSEDFYKPILDTYHSIHKLDNIILVAGLEFGGANDAFYYLTGEWSTRFGRIPMSFDGILFDSRMAVAKESKMADGVKKLIIAAQGTDEYDWEQAYTGSASGVTAIKSELGRLIHVIANRCSVFWKELDSTVFSVPHKKRLEVILEKRDYIINHLNRDHTKPWFGTMPDGRIVDIEDMTYNEIATRLVDLLYIKNKERWIHPSHKKLFNTLLLRIEERFTRTHCNSNLVSVGIHNPHKQIECMIFEYPDTAIQLITSEDVKYFIELCKQCKQKSVPFIPTLDEDFEIWFKKDAVWQSEDLACVPDQDPQRVLIVQGPVAAKYSTEINISVKDILDGIYVDLIDKLAESRYNGNANNIKTIECLVNVPHSSDIPKSIIQCVSDFEREYILRSNVPILLDSSSWAGILAGSQFNWLYALLESKYIINDRKLVKNTLIDVLRPRPGHTVRVHINNNLPSSVEIFDEQDLQVVVVSIDSSKTISVQINNHLKEGIVSLRLQYQYSSKHRLFPLVKLEGNSENSEAKFYRKSVCFGSDMHSSCPTTVETGLSSSLSGFYIDPGHFIDYLKILKCPIFTFKQRAHGVFLIPTDYIFVLAFPTILECITNTQHCDRTINIVYQSNNTRLIPNTKRLCTGDVIGSSSRIVSVADIAAGKQVQVKTDVTRDGEKVAELVTSVVFRGVRSSSGEPFTLTDTQNTQVRIQENEELLVLRSKEWFIPDIKTIESVESGSTLKFSLETRNHYKNRGPHFSSSTTGEVMLVLDDNTMVKVGDLVYYSDKTCANPIIEYLKLFGTPTDNPVYFKDGGYQLFSGSVEDKKFITAPSTWLMFSQISRDSTPIHTNPYIADYVGLPANVIYGTNVGALVRSLIDIYAAENHPERVIAYNVIFGDMVLPRDKLIPSFDHIGMKNGCMLVKGKVVNQNGNTVLEFTAEIEQPLTAYLFTGQGPQHVGMGMDLYVKSKAARAVWDKGNKHMFETYGISILDIVKRNPKRHTVYFKGSKGMRIRDNYIGLVPGVDNDTLYYTFYSESGLLDLTQLIQPILSLFDYARIADMKEHELIQKSARFAGHSFGEFAALCAISGLFSLEDMLDIMFCRGLVLELAAECDERGNSEYRMGAVNPSRIGSEFTVSDLTNITKAIKDHSNGLLELINHNIEGQQYIVAGTVSQLKILSVVLDRVREGGGLDDSSVECSVTYAINQVSSEKSQNGEIKLRRCSVLVPIENVHVPSHSSRMVSFVEPFRRLLLEKLNERVIDPSLLCSRYIPNVVGTPFEISKEYFTKVHNSTNSIEVKAIIDSWDDSWVDDDAKRQQLTKTLFVELVANQIACPVQWISTQNYLLGDDGVDLMVEVGPGPVLSDMMNKSAKAADSKMVVLSTSADQDRIYFRKEIESLEKAERNIKVADKNSITTGTTAITSNINNTATQVKAPQKTISVPDQLDAAHSLEPIADIPLDPLCVIHVIVSQKLNKQLCNVTTDKTIDSLSGGKSTLRNEIVGDLKREFMSSRLDSIDDLSIEDIATKLSTFSGSLGPYTESQISRILRSKLPGGFNKSSMHKYLEATYNIGPMRRNGVILFSLVNEPPNRLYNDNDAQSWLDTLAIEYAKAHRIMLSKSNCLGSAGSASTRALTSADIQALEKAQNGHHQLSTHIIEALANSIGVDLRKGDRKAEDIAKKYSELQSSYDSVVRELGEEFISGIKPMFSHLKARYFDSYWNWARQDLLELFYDLATGKVDISSIWVTEKVVMLKNRSTPALSEFLSFCIKRLGYDLEPLSVDDTTAAFLINLYSECKESLNNPPIYASYRVPPRPHTVVSNSGDITYSEVPTPGISTLNEYIDCVSADRDDGYPLLFVETNAESNSWRYDTEATTQYLDALAAVYSDGVTFSNKRVLLIGCGRYSIGEEILKGLLSGGAKVIATTSSYNRKTILYFEDMYRQYGSRGSELVVVPLNQDSVEDIRNLVQFIYKSPTSGRKGLGWELDHIIPFAEPKCQLNNTENSESYVDMSCRAVPTNVFRLLEEIASVHCRQGNSTQIAQVIVPLLPNHDQTGGDGSNKKAEISLESLVHRWRSEPWIDCFSIVGVSTGWTRKTEPMMESSNVISEGLEKNEIYTFTASEMAANILCVIPESAGIAHSIGPVHLNLSGRLDTVTYLGELLVNLLDEVESKARSRVTINEETLLEFKTINGIDLNKVEAPPIKPRANYRVQFPKHSSYEDIKHLRYMQGMVNLDRIVVVTGFGEVNSHGNASTRWEIEAYGEFSIEGCIELAWMMGHIKFLNGILKSTGNKYIGWVDTKTGEPVDDIDVKEKYEARILEHTGIRLIEPELHDGFNPNKNLFMRELQIEHDMNPFEASKEEAEHFKLQNGDNVEIFENEDGTWSVRFLKGAVIMVPKALQFDRTVAAQIPTGWDPVRYGIPEEIAKQSDPVNWYCLVATVEALLRSGITDPYELYNYLHISKVGSTVGSAVAGRQYLAKMYSYPLLDKDVPKDTSQEVIAGIAAAWSNMLLFSSSGPIKPIAGACATSLVSVDVAMETIQSGKASVMISGGVDGYDGRSAYTFGQINATRNSLEDFSHGRTPAESCRPCTSTRNGFVDGEGSGIMILMSASMAIKMGAPIYGIIALSNTASDKISRSVPALGQGILTTARKPENPTNLELLDFNHRKKHLEAHLELVSQLESKVNSSKMMQEIRKGVQDKWGNDFWKCDDSISPICGALAVWGLDINDIGAVSFHGTSTIANDLNESEIVNLQFKHLGRIPGNAVPVITQKWLTGHLKGAAASLMLNGLLQVLNTGLVPGNRNADNIEEKLEKFEYLVYPSKSIQTSGIKAGLLKSFGFGQVSGELLVVHPDYILATLSRDELKQYKEKVDEREKRVYRYWHDTFIGEHTFVQVKDEPPYTKEQEQNVYLDPNARTKYNPKTKKHHF